MDENKGGFQDRTKAGFKLASSLVFGISAVVADVLVGFYWWNTILTSGVLWFLLHIVWRDRYIRGRVRKWIPIRASVFVYLFILLLVISTLFFMWGNSHGTRAESSNRENEVALITKEVERLEARIDLEQSEKEKLRDDNDRLRDANDLALQNQIALLAGIKAAPGSTSGENPPPEIPMGEVYEPESEKNKFVNARKIDDPIQGDGEHAMLLEFGVTKLSTDSVLVGLQFDLAPIYYEEWFGIPGKTERQQKPGMSMGTFELQDTRIIKRDELNRITPRQSYYIYLEFEKQPMSITVQFLAEKVSLLLAEEELLERSVSYIKNPGQSIQSTPTDPPQ